MTSILLAAISYFFGALTVIFDKYLLGSQKISSPATYAFYVGLLGMGVLIFWPLGFLFDSFVLVFPSVSQFFLALQSGVLFMAAITALYFAIKKNEASKVTPVVYSVIPIVTLITSYFYGIEKFSYLKIMGIFFLIFGGLLISFDLPLKLKKKKFFKGFYLSIFSGILMGFSLFLLKLLYEQQNFFNGYVWSRFGAFLGAFFLLLVPSWRRGIISSFSHAKKNKQENIKTGSLFIFNKILGGSSSALINLAIGIGSVTLVSSMISLQYIFVFVIAVLAGAKLPHIFEERMLFWDWMQKIVAIAIISFGMFLIF